jgi:hypothetical protein
MAADYTYDYTVVIQGNDYDPDYGWADEHYHLKDESFDTYEEACEFVRGITPEQALEWERETECNGLDIVIFADPLIDWMYELSFEALGFCEWIGDKLNLMDL